MSNSERLLNYVVIPAVVALVTTIATIWVVERIFGR